METLKKWATLRQVTFKCPPGRVTANVQEVFTSCTDDTSRVLSGPLQYGEVARVCLQLKPGGCGVFIDYEHVKFAGPDLWILLQDVYQEFSESC